MNEDIEAGHSLNDSKVVLLPKLKKFSMCERDKSYDTEHVDEDCPGDSNPLYHSMIALFEKAIKTAVLRSQPKQFCFTSPAHLEFTYGFVHQFVTEGSTVCVHIVDGDQPLFADLPVVLGALNRFYIPYGVSPPSILDLAGAGRDLTKIYPRLLEQVGMGIEEYLKLPIESRLDRKTHVQVFCDRYSIEPSDDLFRGESDIMDVLGSKWLGPVEVRCMELPRWDVCGDNLG